MSFFGGMPFPVQFFLAFIVVLGLIGATAWAVRRFGGGRLGSVGMRGRQPRLAVVDYASVDARRRLLLIRRDNVEHLVMIGGPTDVVVESNIVRASPAQRDMTTSPRPPALAETPSRAIALPDTAPNGSWTSPAEPAPAAMPRAPRGELPLAEPVPFPLQQPADPQPRPQREPLVALADEIAPKPMPPRNRPQAPRPPEPRQDAPYEPRPEPRQEPRIAVAQPQPAPLAAEVAAATDQSLAEMAHRLEAALRKPNAKADRNPTAAEPRAVPMPRAPMPAEPLAAAEPAPPPPAVPSPAPVPLPPRGARAAEAKPRTDAKPPAAGKTLYDSLEQEMASLLGRSNAKS